MGRAPRRTVAIKDLLASGELSFSFEFMPPRSDSGERALWNAIRELEGLAPTFVSITYGAGGKTRERTVRTSARIARDTTMLPVGHLTAVDHSESELRHTIGQYADAGVQNVLALRGDPSGDPLAEWVADPDGLAYAADLVRLVRSCGEFCVGVAAFPEMHPGSTDRGTDVDHFVAKVRAGADFAITQMLFTVEDYLRFRDQVAARGCDVPILPGIMPVTRMGQVARFAELRGRPLPAEIVNRLERVCGDEAAVRQVGIDHAVDTCAHLLDEGVPGLHFYTFNRSDATREIYRRLQLRRTVRAGSTVTRAGPQPD